MIQRRTVLLTGVKIVVVMLSVYYLFRMVPVSDAVTALGIPSAAELTVAGLLVVLTTLLTSYILRQLTAAYDDVPMRLLVKLYVMNFALNSFIPSKAGSLITMPLLFDRYTTLDRIQGLNVQLTNLVLTAVTLGTTTIIGLVLLLSYLESELVVVLLSSGLIYLAIPLLSLGVHSSTRVPFLNYSLDRIDYSAFNGTVLLQCLAVTALSVIGVVGIRFFVITTSLGISFSLPYYFFVPVLVYAVSVLPISVGGIGISELTGTSVLIGIGIAPELAAAVILLDRSISFYIPVVITYLYTLIELRTHENTSG